jgi:hypothetical protein
VRPSIVSDREHPPVAEGVICIDFDATLFPWGGISDDIQPLPGAVETVKALKDKGYKIVIFTSRMSPTWWKAEGWENDMYTNITQWGIVCDRLIRYGIPFDLITCEKVPAIAYIDDKAIEFRGDWEEIRKRLIG